jgi:hypothetical protein
MGGNIKYPAVGGFPYLGPSLVKRERSAVPVVPIDAVQRWGVYLARLLAGLGVL